MMISPIYGKRDYGTLNFMVEIIGCPDQKYGLACNETCKCSNGVRCHSFNGQCMCPTGLTGGTCDIYNPVIEVTSQSVYPIWGSDIELVCTVHGILNAIVTWRKDGMIISTNNTILNARYTPKPTQSIHLVNNVTTRDNGVYTCNATNKVTAFILNTVKLTVLKIPDPFIDTSSNRTVKVGSNVTLTCMIKPAAGTVVWVKGQQFPTVYSMLNTSDRIQVVANSTLGLYQLTITNVSLQDESIYRCYVGHIFTDDDITFAVSHVVVYVDPIEPFPRIIGYNEFDSYEVKLGNVIDLKCETNLSKPAAELFWFLGSSLMKPSDNSTESRDALLFNTTTVFSKTATISDNGQVLKCQAKSPGFDEASTEVVLNVTYKPFVTLYPESINIKEGADVSISCNASSNPAPTSYEWTVKLTNGTRVVQPNQIFKLNNVPGDFNNAQCGCIVTNGIGLSSANVTKFTVIGPGPNLQLILPLSVFGVVLVVVFLSIVVYRYRFEIRTLRAHYNILLNDLNGDIGLKEYDFFIAYKSGGEDEDFVVTLLTPHLVQMGYKVCVHYKHFIPGNAIMDNIVDSVDKSRQVILILSPSFLESTWCQYEFQIAYANMLTQRSDILPIMFKDILDLPNLDGPIRILLNSITYLTWTSREVDENLEERFWRDLENSAPPIQNR